MHAQDLAAGRATKAMTEPREESQVEVALERLASQTPDLHNLLSELHHRLGPILRGAEDEPANPHQPGTPRPEIVRVALAEAIDLQATSVFHATLILRDILQRFEL